MCGIFLYVCYVLVWLCMSLYVYGLSHMCDMSMFAWFYMWYVLACVAHILVCMCMFEYVWACLCNTMYVHVHVHVVHVLAYMGISLYVTVCP